MTALLDFPPLWFALAALAVLLVMVPCARWLDGPWRHNEPPVVAPERREARVPVTPARTPAPVTALRVRAERIDQVAS